MLVSHYCYNNKYIFAICWRRMSYNCSIISLLIITTIIIIIITTWQLFGVFAYCAIMKSIMCVCMFDESFPLSPGLFSVFHFYRWPIGVQQSFMLALALIGHIFAPNSVSNAEHVKLNRARSRLTTHTHTHI